MLLLTLVPYFIILFGFFLGYAGVRPAMLAWATCMLGAMSGLAIGILSFWQTQLWMMAGIAGLPFVIVALMTARDLTYPLINDVTTDVNHPPAFVAALDALPNRGRDMVFRDHFGPIISKSYPKVRPIRLNLPPLQVHCQARELIKETPGWVIKYSDETNGTIEAEVTTAVLGFVDDVMIRISEESDKTRVDMRSKSREGLVDGGCNAKRVQAFLERLRGRLQSLPEEINPVERPAVMYLN